MVISTKPWSCNCVRTCSSTLWAKPGVADSAKAISAARIIPVSLALQRPRRPEAPSFSGLPESCVEGNGPAFFARLVGIDPVNKVGREKDHLARLWAQLLF